MSTLSSSSSLAQVEAAHADNASYAEDNSVAKARAFITACRILLLKYPKRTGTPQAELETSIDLVQKEKKAAEDWVAAHDTGPASTTAGPRVTRVSFENTR
jgi:alpha-D-ribose 1-methylphosphonate 5-triphosphate synthase subunit PhnL